MASGNQPAKVYGAAAVMQGSTGRYTLTHEMVMQSWYQPVRNAAGKDAWLLETVSDMIKEAKLPGMECHQAEVSAGGMFGEKRTFLVATINTLREYRMFIGARDIGVHLEASWYLTVNPGFLKRAISKKVAGGNPQALSMNINVFAQQDLGAFCAIASDAVYEAVKHIMEQLEQDTSGLSPKSKGFLDLW